MAKSSFNYELSRSEKPLQERFFDALQKKAALIVPPFL